MPVHVCFIFQVQAVKSSYLSCMQEAGVSRTMAVHRSHQQILRPVLGPQWHACMFEFQSGLSRTYAESKDSESECGQNAAENREDEGSKLDQIQQDPCMQGKMKHEEQYVSPASSSGLPRTRACIHVCMILHGRVKVFTCHMPRSWLQTLFRSLWCDRPKCSHTASTWSSSPGCKKYTFKSSMHAIISRAT